MPPHKLPTASDGDTDFLEDVAGGEAGEFFEVFWIEEGVGIVFDDKEAGEEGVVCGGFGGECSYCLNGKKMVGLDCG